MSNLTGGLFKALAHFHLGAHLVGQFYGQMKCLRLALPQNRQEKLAMELLAVGASAVGLAALAAAFDERAGKHLAPRAQSANQPAAQGEIGVVGHLTLIIVSELGEVKLLREFARMTGKLSRPLLLLVQCIGPASEVALRNRYRLTRPQGRLHGGLREAVKPSPHNREQEKPPNHVACISTECSISFG